MTRTRQKAGRLRDAGVPEGLYGPAGKSSAAVMVVLVMNRLMRPEQAGVAAIARGAREKEGSRRGQVMAQYSDTFETSAMVTRKNEPIPGEVVGSGSGRVDASPGS